MKKITNLVFVVYKIFISSAIKVLFGGGCKYTPTCSEYAKDAVQLHGFFYGTVFSVKRIVKCHPFSSGGFDPVPTSR